MEIPYDSYFDSPPIEVTNSFTKLANSVINLSQFATIFTLEIDLLSKDILSIDRKPEVIKLIKDVLTKLKYKFIELIIIMLDIIVLEYKEEFSEIKSGQERKISIEKLKNKFESLKSELELSTQISKKFSQFFSKLILKSENIAKLVLNIYGIKMNLEEGKLESINTFVNIFKNPSVNFRLITANGFGQRENSGSKKKKK